jgi:hypothetical protein
MRLFGMKTQVAVMDAAFADMTSSTLGLTAAARLRRAGAPNLAPPLYATAPAATGDASRSARAACDGAARSPTRWQIANTRSARFMV